jgi:hypothetical protein
METKIMGFPGDEIWICVGAEADIFGNWMSVPKARICKLDMLGEECVIPHTATILLLQL